MSRNNLLEIYCDTISRKIIYFLTFCLRKIFNLILEVKKKFLLQWELLVIENWVLQIESDEKGTSKSFKTFIKFALKFLLKILKYFLTKVNICSSEVCYKSYCGGC